MKFFVRMQERWGLGVWGVGAVLMAFALAGTTTVALRGHVIRWLLPAEAPGWIQWAVYLAIMERWTPSFGQVFVTAKVESGVMIQATLG